jgi:hypothetical protein
MQVAADTIKASLDKLPGSPRTQIGFLTFDSTLHFYNLKVCTEVVLAYEMELSRELSVDVYVRILDMDLC